MTLLSTIKYEVTLQLFTNQLRLMPKRNNYTQNVSAENGSLIALLN